MRFVFLRMVCQMIMVLGEGKGSYCPQTGKDFQPSTQYANGVAHLHIFAPFKVLLVFNFVRSRNLVASIIII